MRHGVERLWDAAVKPIAFRPSIKDDEEETTDLARELPEIALLTGLSIDAITEIHRALLSAIEIWDRDGEMKAVSQISLQLRSIPGLVSRSMTSRFLNTVHCWSPCLWWCFNISAWPAFAPAELHGHDQ